MNLRGYDPGEPVTARAALQWFLVALGVPASSIPPETDAAAALYRSLLADRRMLIVLDNAATVSQVRPLLPGNNRSLAVITSRSRLSGLAIHEGAHHLTLSTFAEPESVMLLRAVIAGYRSGDDADKLAELARLCARLPLALRIAAERAASHPHMRLDDLIADLRDESALWSALSIGDEEEADAVRSVFTWSYRALSVDAARLFRLLGLHPGPEFGTGAVAALVGTSVRRARQSLDALVGAHLLEQTAPDRYEFHDLLRAYAADQAQREESAEDRSSALRRVLEWYLHTADAAQTWIEPAEDHLDLDPPQEGVVPVSFADFDQAVEWAEREHSNILVLVREASRAGLDRQTWQLSAVLWNAQSPSAPFTDWLAAGQTGLDAARRLGDRAGEALLLVDLGMANSQINRFEPALECHHAALAIRQETGDRLGEADSLNVLALTYLRMRRLEEAQELLQQSLAAFQELETPAWQALVRSNLSLVHYQAGRLEEAAEVARQALTAHRESGDKANVGDALRNLSAIHLDSGRLDDALSTAQEAVEIALELRDHFLEGHWLLALGDAQQALGHHAEALASYHRSAVLHRRLGDRSREALAWFGAGETCHRLGQDTEAANFHRQAATVHHELGDAWNEATTLCGLAAAVESDDIASARQLWTEALELISGFSDLRATQARERIETLLTGPGRGA